MSEQRVVFDQAEVELTSMCPGCGAPVPVPVAVVLTVCDCGLHQTIVSTPDLTDMAAHLWTHDMEAS